MNIRLSRDSQKFIATLNQKQARQIALKIKELESLGHLHDSKLLGGADRTFYRVEVSEFRIIYKIEVKELIVFLLGKRNDNEIYKLFNRKKLK